MSSVEQIKSILYRTEIEVPHKHQLAAASWIVLALEVEGRKIKDESACLLPEKQTVQTFHCKIGGFGAHSQKTCVKVEIEIKTRAEHNEIQRVVKNAVSEYTAIYGDRTKSIDPVTGKPKTIRHFELKEFALGRFSLEIIGSAGRTDMIFESDCAITKMAYIVRRIISEIAGASVKLAGQTPDSNKLVLEGGQSFLPTHELENVMCRMSVAAKIGLAEYVEVFGAPGAKCHTTFGKILHADIA